MTVPFAIIKEWLENEKSLGSSLLRYINSRHHEEGCNYHIAALLPLEKLQKNHFYFALNKGLEKH